MSISFLRSTPYQSLKILCADKNQILCARTSYRECAQYIYFIFLLTSENPYGFGHSIEAASALSGVAVRMSTHGNQLEFLHFFHMVPFYI
jgi:hypothetical protein